MRWDEGPIRQSERTDLYDEVLADLLDRGLAYVCSCSRADVRAAASAPHLAPGSEVPYPGTCRPPPARSLPPDRGGIRLAVETLGDGARVRFEDLWCGEQLEDVRRTCGDFLLGRPGSPSYQLASVVDDGRMGVTDVVRGRDLLGSTARQVLLHRALGSEAPSFAHHPLLVDEEGRKLSKRDRDLSLSGLRQAGADPRRVLARLAVAIGLAPAGTEALSPDDLVPLLDPPLSWGDGTLGTLPEGDRWAMEAAGS